MNPQAAVTAAVKTSYDGHPELGQYVDPDTWMTPRYILDELGLFDLDPCAADAAPEWVAPESYTKADNGLTRLWHGRVFCNPPFSNAAPWIRKHAEHGKGISLVTASVESRVWREVVWKRAEYIVMLHGRVRFCNPDGSRTTGRPLRAVALLAWGREDGSILQSARLAGVYFRKHGWEVR